MMRHVHARRSAATVVLLLLLGLCAPQVHAKQEESSVFDQIDLLVDIRHELVNEYVEEPDDQEMVRSAVRAMVDTLHDPYTVFMLPSELEQFERQVRGSFSGIGAEVDISEDRLRIVSPLEDSPAWKAGILPGDIVLEIDGVSTLGMKLTECITRLTGKAGTPVTIRVRHETGEEIELTITRARINVDTVRGLERGANMHWEYMLDRQQRIGYVRIAQFTDTTVESMDQVLTELRDRGVAALIIDLRFNPGGLLDAAATIADRFLPAGKTIVSVRGRIVPETTRTSTDAGTYPDIPIVVLANEASASAAEILTGALADNDRALFVGARTFGKGSVQQVRMLENGQGALKITNAYYYLPSGRNIHRREGSDVWGVDPSEGCYVPMTAEEVRTMVETRQSRRKLLPAGSDAAVTPELIEQELHDLQLAAGLRAAQGRLATGDWPQVGKSGAQQLALESRRQNLQRQREALMKRLGEVELELQNLDDLPVEEKQVQAEPHDAPEPELEPDAEMPDDAEDAQPPIEVEQPGIELQEAPDPDAQPQLDVELQPDAEAQPDADAAPAPEPELELEPAIP